jgi:hypothetical protein
MKKQARMQLTHAISHNHKSYTETNLADHLVHHLHKIILNSVCLILE